ncbi:histidine ammonia-lyase [Candidatus Woesearchaeota archaeon]|nr:histidine ammonia-lyase [Candidatus Woesearchaeota archaeon]
MNVNNQKNKTTKEKHIGITGNDLSLDDFILVARHKYKVFLTKEAKKRILKCRKVVDNLVEDEKVVYGLTTGFGSLANISISADKAEELQENLLRSHACGVGRPFSEEIVRGIMLLRVNTFAKGFSGIRLSAVETIIEMLNKGIYPFVPEQGSVGSSGDLCPLSHLFLVMIGEGEVFLERKRVCGAEAMKKLGIKPIKLTSKEGLALNNGTPVMTAIAAIAVYDSFNLIQHSIISSAITMEALKANSSALKEEIHLARPHQGQIRTAQILRKILRNSQLIDSNKKKVQDAYSIRATPVVIGASLDTLNYVKQVVDTEMNSATDNPLIFGENAYSGANFHGQPIALVMDFLGIAMSEIADLSERRISRLLDSSLNEGLPPFLINKPGLNSGLMIPQYTAASLVSENKVLAHPASVDSIPTCANQEDHVSMGTIAARKVLKIIFNVQNVIAIEMLTAAQALEMRIEYEKLLPGPVVTEVLKTIRTFVDYLEQDRVLYKDINKLSKAILERKLIKELSYNSEIA